MVAESMNTMNLYGQTPLPLTWSGATLTGPAPTQPPVDNVPKAPENGGGEEGGAGGENDPEVPGGEIPGVPEMPEVPLVPADNPNPTTGQTGTETA